MSHQEAKCFIKTSKFWFRPINKTTIRTTINWKNRYRSSDSQTRTSQIKSRGFHSGQKAGSGSVPISSSDETPSAVETPAITSASRFSETTTAFLPDSLVSVHFYENEPAERGPSAVFFTCRHVYHLWAYFVFPELSVTTCGLPQWVMFAQLPWRRLKLSETPPTHTQPAAITWLIYHHIRAPNNDFTVSMATTPSTDEGHKP